MSADNAPYEFLEKKIEWICVHQAQIMKSLDDYRKEVTDALKEMRQNCRADMADHDENIKDMYGKLNEIRRAFTDKLEEIQAHVHCQEGKSITWDKVVVVGMAIFMFVQAVFTMWPHVKG